MSRVDAEDGAWAIRHGHLVGLLGDHLPGEIMRRIILADVIGDERGPWRGLPVLEHQHVAEGAACPGGGVMMGRAAFHFATVGCTRKSESEDAGCDGGPIAVGIIPSGLLRPGGQVLDILVAFLRHAPPLFRLETLCQESVSHADAARHLAAEQRLL